MIPMNELRKIARAKFKDAEALYKARRYDSAVYLCGYTIEAALKARICRTLKWSEFPSTRADFSDYQSLRTHDLEVLLHLSGIENKITTQYITAWSTVARWNPEMRYQPVGTTTSSDARTMLDSVKVLLEVI